MTPQEVRDLLGSLDGYGKKSIQQARQRISNDGIERVQLNTVINRGKANNWHWAPRVSQEFKDKYKTK